MSALRAEIVRDPAGLGRLEPDWARLWLQCPTATPFQSPAWLLPWWRAFSPGALSVVAVWSGHDLVGLAPFYLEGDASNARLLPIGIAVTDYHDILCQPSLEASVCAAIAETARTVRWVQWILPDLAADAVAVRLASQDFEPEFRHGDVACPVLQLASDGAFTSTVPARRRRQLRRAGNAAQRRGRVTIRRGESDPAEFLHHLVRLQRARWVGRGGGVLADRATIGFHAGALPRLMANRLTRCWLIEIGEAVVGAYYGLHHRDRAYAYLGGFDPSYADESPGAILIGEAIAQALREGAREFDFLRGRENYKYGWGANDRWTSSMVWTRMAKQ